MFETNSASCGGFKGISDSYGAALWATDYGLQMAFNNFTHAMLHVGGQNAFYNVRQFYLFLERSALTPQRFFVAIHRSADEPVEFQRVDRGRGVLRHDHPRGGIRYERPVAPHRPVGQLWLCLHTIIRDLRRRCPEQGRAFQLPR